jgi:hypothetical protein
MRGREEGLGYWLSGREERLQPGIWLRLSNLILRRLKSGRLTPVTGEFSLVLETAVRTSGLLISNTSPVKDGLGLLAPAMEKASRRPTENELRVLGLELFSTAGVRPLPLPGEVPVGVNEAGWIRTPFVRSLQGDPWERKACVRSVASPEYMSQARTYDRWLAPSHVLVKLGTPGLALLPLTVRAMEPSMLNENERASFLREAAALRGVTPDQGELLAVFRSVPIEVVSRLSFNKESRTIVYKLTFNPALRRTRVHDLAAVLDTASGEIHLVPHRARYRTVFLN